MCVGIVELEELDERLDEDYFDILNTGCKTPLYLDLHCEVVSYIHT